MSHFRVHKLFALVFFFSCAGLLGPQSGVCAQDRVQPTTQDGAASTSAPQPNSTVNAPVTDTKNASTSELLIGEGDLLQISLYGVPEFNQQARVSGEGKIPVPMIGDVYVRSLTTTQAEASISKQLKDQGFFRNPQVTVLIREFATQGVSVLGEVQKPGIYPVMGPRKLFDLVSVAGGTTPRAGRDILISHRGNPASTQVVTLSSDDTKQMESNAEIFPGDTIVVTRAAIVYVVGDVRLPGGFVVDKGSGLSILQAIALAQGATNTASLNSSKVIHKTPTGATETAVHLKQILEGKAEDLKLQADDILFVPHSAGKAAAMRGMDAALQAATGAAIYRF
jgi:polysaccharide biosynthesis/export protein